MTRSGKLRHPARERGAVLAFMVIVLIPLIGIIALAIDSFTMRLSRSQQDGNAELAAISALEAFFAAASNPVQAAQTRAEAIAGVNTYLSGGSSVPVRAGELSGAAGHIEVGIYYPELRIFAPVALPAANHPSYAPTLATIDAIRVTLKTRAGFVNRTFLASLFGLASFQLNSSAVAYRDPGLVAKGDYPFVIAPQTAS